MPRILVWNLTFVFYCIKVRENFLPIPTYAKNWLSVNRVGKVPLNYWSWLLIGQKLRGKNFSNDWKQIEWDLAGSLKQYPAKSHSIDWQSIEWELEFRGYCSRDPAKSHSIDWKQGEWVQSFYSTKSCQLHSICFKSDIFPLKFWPIRGQDK